MLGSLVPFDFFVNTNTFLIDESMSSHFSIIPIGETLHFLWSNQYLDIGNNMSCGGGAVASNCSDMFSITCDLWISQYKYQIMLLILLITFFSFLH